MDTKKRKELLAAYKERHPEMGVIGFQCRATGEMFLTTAADTAAKFNRVRFQLSTGKHPNKRLQELWTQHGPRSTTVSPFPLTILLPSVCKKPFTRSLENLFIFFILLLTTFLIEKYFLLKTTSCQA